MDEIKNVLICGIGAVGSIYAVKIQNSKNHNLKVLVDVERFKKYKSSPLIFNDVEYNFDYVLPEDQNFKADLIIIATKFSGFSRAKEDIKNFLKDDTIILSLLNGVTSENDLAGLYGWKRVLLSYCICHSAVRRGRCVVHDGVSKIVFGANEFFENSKENVLKVKSFFEQCGIDYEIPDDIKRSMWLKFMLNISANPLSAIFRMTFGEMLKNAKFMDMAYKIILEAQQIAIAEGIKNADTMPNEAMQLFNAMIPEGKTSMLQDVEAGRKTEIDLFSGAVVKLGEKYNIPTPYNKFVKEMVEIIHKNQDSKQ